MGACKDGSYDPVQQRCKVKGDEKEYKLLKQRRQTLEAWDWKKWLGNSETKRWVGSGCGERMGNDGG